MKINEKNLCVFATMPPYDCEGFLRKRGEVNKAFQRRYFVLKGNLLFYFEKKGDKEPLGLIIVEGCTIEMSQECDPYCFEIVFKDKRTYVLSADTQESMEAWMKVLTCAGYEFKKLTIEKLQEQLKEIETAREKILVPVAPAPKLPEIRKNPFNTIRPAPPIPSTEKVNIVNGHFGSASSLTNQIDESNSSSPTRPPRRNPATANGSRLQSIDSGNTHQQVPSANSSQSVFYPTYDNCFNNPPTANATSKLPQKNYNSTSSINPTATHSQIGFEQVHERFRPIVMRDVLDYRAKAAKPLIDI